MLVYQATKREFMDDVLSGVIAGRIETAFESRVHRPSASEKLSWLNSMQYMHMVLGTESIPGDCGVAIEFGVPYTNSPAEAERPHPTAACLHNAPWT